MTRIAVSGRAPVARAFLQVARERGLGVVAVHDVGDLDDDLGPTTIKLDRSAQPDWTALDVDVLVDCSEGVRSREQLAGHLAVGASAVVAAGPVVRTDAVVVMGVNDADHRPREHRVVSTASPLVLAVAPLLQVLLAEFGVERGFVTTTCGDVRLAGLETVLPDLSGRIDVASVDVASGTTSFVDLSLLLARVTDVDDVNAALRIAARGRPALALRYSERPVLAEDVTGDPASAVIDSTLTRASGELVKVVARFDPVWAQAHRLADAVGMLGDRLEPSSLPAVYRPAAPDVVLAPVASVARGPVRMITARPSPAASLRLSNGFEERQVGDRWVIRARARGLAPRDLDLRLGECTLTLDTRQGRSPRLHQVFSVPEGLDPRDVTVRLEDDVLCIEMPLSAALSGAR